MAHRTWALSLLLLCIALTGCKSTYYKTMEKFGYEKRDLLVDRVTDARDDQQQAKEQFQTTLQRLQELSGQDGSGKLETVYDKLKKDYDRCEARAEDVRNRIKGIEEVADDLWTEWSSEIDEMSNAKLKRQNQQQLDATKARYGELISKMKASSAKMDPVLSAFKDQVLFLKGSLNAQAIASLQETSVEIETEVQELITEMNAAIAEADDFIGSMQS